MCSGVDAPSATSHCPGALECWIWRVERVISVESSDRVDMEPIGADLAFGMLHHARTDAPLLQGDGLSLPIPDGAVDGVTCGFALRNLADLDRCFAELARVLRPGGRIALSRSPQPSNPVLQWAMSCISAGWSHSSVASSRAEMRTATYRVRSRTCLRRT